jgi:hypothetical protein
MDLVMRWKALLERWGEQSLGTIKTARIINSVKWKITRIEPTFGEGLSSGGEVFAQCSPGKCTDAHNCAWDAVSYFMPGKGDVIEVVRRPLWGFKLDSEFGPKAYAGLETFLNYTTKEMKDKRILFHILVGEGVSRERFLNAFKHSLKHQAAEVWILEHNREAISWVDEKSWPRIHGEVREKGSTMYSLAELKVVTSQVGNQNCLVWKFLCSGCYSPTSQVSQTIDNRNMLLGGRCV